MGSIGGGGRYDDLTGIFLENMSGVGISLLDRIYLVVEELNLFQKPLPNIKSAVYYYGDTEGFTPAGYTKSYEVCIKVELYPDNAKVKQFQHADKRSIPLQ
jgi:histidyl-tRNA synthetase